MTTSEPRPIPYANLIRIRRASVAYVVCIACAVIGIYVTVTHFSYPSLILTLTILAEAALAWTARVVYGWIEVTPRRVEYARLIRWAPAALGLFGIAVAWTLHNVGVSGGIMSMMLIAALVLISDVAAAVAGSIR